MSKPLLFCTQSYQYLANRILKLRPEFELGVVERREFPDGEHYLRIQSELEHRDVTIVSGTISDRETLELYDLSCALVKYGARRLTLVIPFFGYSTMERQTKPGEVVTAKTRARLLSAIPLAAQGNRAFLIDLHSDGIPHYFEGTIRAVAVSARAYVEKMCHHLAGSDFVLGSTDAGRAKWVESLANEMGVKPAFVYKRRTDGSTTEVTGVSAYVENKPVVIYDDMIRTGGSLIQAARAYKTSGATDIYAVATHGVLPGESLKRLQDSGLFKTIACSDSHPRAHAIASANQPFLHIFSLDQLICSL